MYVMSSSATCMLRRCSIGLTVYVSLGVYGCLWIAELQCACSISVDCHFFTNASRLAQQLSLQLPEYCNWNRATVYNDMLYDVLYSLVWLARLLSEFDNELENVAIGMHSNFLGTRKRLIFWVQVSALNIAQKHIFLPSTGKKCHVFRLFGLVHKMSPSANHTNDTYTPR